MDTGRIADFHSGGMVGTEKTETVVRSRRGRRRMRSEAGTPPPRKTGGDQLDGRPGLITRPLPLKMKRGVGQVDPQKTVP